MALSPRRPPGGSAKLALGGGPSLGRELPRPGHRRAQADRDLLVGDGQRPPGGGVPAGPLDPQGQPEMAVGLLEQALLDPVDVPGQRVREVARRHRLGAVVEQGEQVGHGVVGRGGGAGRVEQAGPGVAAAAREIGADGRPGVGQQQPRQVPGRHRAGHAAAEGDLGDLHGRVAGAELVAGAARALAVQVQPDGLVVDAGAAAEHGHPGHRRVGGHGLAQRRGPLAGRGLQGGHGRTERRGRGRGRLRVGVVRHDQVEPELGAGQGAQPVQGGVVGPGGRRPPDVADAGRLEPLGGRPGAAGVAGGQVHPDAVQERPGGHGRLLLRRGNGRRRLGGGRGPGPQAGQQHQRDAGQQGTQPRHLSSGARRGDTPDRRRMRPYREHNGSGQASAPTWTTRRPPPAGPVTCRDGPWKG